MIKASDTYQELAVNKKEEPVMATATASGDTLSIRGALLVNPNLREHPSVFEGRIL